MVSTVRTLARRSDAVLVIIDVQERLAAAMAHRDRVVGTCCRLSRVAALTGLPIIVTRQYPRGLGGTDESLEACLLGVAEGGGSVQGVDKTAFCCCNEEDFLRPLAATGRTQVLLAGMETHICVCQTALDLIARGFDVQVIADACTSRDDTNHELALSRMRAAGIVVTTSESVMYELVGRAGTDEFKSLLALVKDA